MPYWRRPKFWIVLALAEIATFVLSAVVTMGIELLLEELGVSNRHVGVRSNTIGIIINLYLAYEVFRFARNRARRWPQPRGFDVIISGAVSDEEMK